MPDPTDDLIQQMVQAGLYPEQIAALQPRLRLGQQWMQPQEAQGRQVGNTYVASSPFEHLSNAIRQIVGAKMAGGALEEQRDLTGKLAAGRKAYGQAIQTANGVPGPGVPEMLARPADPQEAQRLAGMGALSGDPAIASMGHALTQSLQFAQQHGPQAALGGQTPDVYNAITKRQEVPKWQGLGGFPVLFNSRTGQTTTLPIGPGGLPTDLHTMREREKRKAGMFIGPDLEPTEETLSGLEAGGVDPRSPGMQDRLKNLSELNTGAAGFADVAQRLRQFLDKHPHGQWAGTDATEAEAIAQDLRSLYMKNLNMQSLRAYDVPILNKVISDPTTLINMMRSGSGALDLRKQLDTAVNLAKQRTLSEAKALGYRPTGKGRFAGFSQVTDQPNAATQAPTGPSRPRRTVNGETREWDGQKWVPAGG